MTAPVCMTEVLLRELRVDRLRLQLAINDIDAIGVALRSGLIGPEEAIGHMHAMGLGELEADFRYAESERRAA